MNYRIASTLQRAKDLDRHLFFADSMDMIGRHILWCVSVSGLVVAWCAIGHVFGTDHNRRPAVVSNDVVALVGFTRSEAEAALGVANFCADSWVPSERESIRRGGLRMQHTQVVFKQARTHDNSRVGIWNSGPDLTAFVERISSGDLCVHDFPLGIALDRPPSILIAQFGSNGRIESTTMIRPSFVIIEP